MTEERLREKTMIIQQLNQKVESLQTQLSGTQRRANELSAQVEQLEQMLIEKDQEIVTLKAEVSKYRSALEKMGQEVQEVRAEQIQSMSRKDQSGTTMRTEEIQELQRTVSELYDRLKTLSEAAMAVMNDEPDSKRGLREALMKAGDNRTRVLNLILTRRNVKLDEIASFLVIDVNSAYDIVDELRLAGEVETPDENTVIPAAKYREVKIPTEEWKQAPVGEIFDSLVSIIEKMESNDEVSKALEIAVDLIEQKLSRGGALIFEMRRTASSWAKNPGDIQELQYKIRDWKVRAMALS